LKDGGELEQLPSSQCGDGIGSGVALPKILVIAPWVPLCLPNSASVPVVRCLPGSGMAVSVLLRSERSEIPSACKKMAQELAVCPFSSLLSHCV